jgi:hypothetical protein
MSQLARKISSKEGLPMFDIIGAMHVVRTVKRGLQYEVESSFQFGPNGEFGKERCSLQDEARNILPRSRSQFEPFMREQKELLWNSDQSNEDQAKTAKILSKFEAKMKRRIEVVMGRVGSSSEMSQHITLWSILLQYLIVTWNGAMIRDKPKYLLRDLDHRWEREFQDKCSFANGTSAQPIEDSLKFLQYRCPNPKCGALGMCAEICCFCQEGPSSAPKASSTFKHSLADTEKAFKAWVAKAKAGGKTNKAAFY